VFNQDGQQLDMIIWLDLLNTRFPLAALLLPDISLITILHGRICRALQAQKYLPARKQKLYKRILFSHKDDTVNKSHKLK